MNSTTLARNIVRQLIEVGIADFVLSPGSRNAPLSIALYEAEQAGFIDLHVRIDERGAAFYALGLSKASDNYVAVICTSGTAVANYHPAALEAYHSANKLLFLTADRPAHLRRTGANQTTIQVGLLAPIETIDIAAAVTVSEFLSEGPVHFNVQFDEPLLSDDRTDWLAGLTPKPLPPKYSASEESFSPESRGVLIVGHDRAGFTPDAITFFANSLGWPVIAEDPLSFPEAVAHASLFLTDREIREALRPDQIVVIGRTTLSRSINSFIKECEEVVVVDPRTRTLDTNRSASQVFTDFPSGYCEKDSVWMDRWRVVSANAHAALDLEWSEQSAIASIAAALPDGSALFIGSSRPVRDLEAFAAPRSGIHTFANRGLAGIDGNTSTAFGIAEKFERSYAIVGDLTFLHDISALVNPSSANLTIFVIDNNGGGIFNTLPQSGVDGFEKIFATPHDVDLMQVIKGFGGNATKVKNSSDLLHAIVHQSPGLNFVIVEVPDRERNASSLKEVTQSLVSALRIGSNLA